MKHRALRSLIIATTVLALSTNGRAQRQAPSPEDAGAMIRALTDAWLGNNEAALSTLSTLESRHPVASVYAAMADVYTSMGRNLDAQNALQRAATAGSDALFYRVRMGDLQLEQNKVAEAAATYQAVLNDGENNAGALVGLARIAEQRGDIVEARRLLDQANTTSPTIESLDLAAALESKPNDQRQTAERDEAREPDDGTPTIGGSADEALRRLENHPQDVDAWKAALEALAVTPHSRAVSVAEDALLLFPRRPELVIPAAEILVENGQKAEASAAVEPFLNDDGVDAEYRSRAQDVIDSHQEE